MVQLCQHRDEFEHLNVEVLLVSFSSKGYARRWTKEVCPAFRLLLDREKAVYRAYELGHSLSRALNTRTIKSYAQFVRADRPLRIQGDPAQLGGDFIIDTEGAIRLAYRSHDPTDRPSAEQLLTVLNKLVER